MAPPDEPPKEDIEEEPTGTRTTNAVIYQKQPAPDGKVYFSYRDVHATIQSLVPRLLASSSSFQPTVLLAIGSGGFLPARILRTSVHIPLLTVTLQLYNDDKDNNPNDNQERNEDKPQQVRCLQWFDETTWPGTLVRGGNVLIVDEVDDTRLTLQYCVEQVFARHDPRQVGVAVVHNKRKAKRGTLPATVHYFAGATVPDYWHCYPWDAEAYDQRTIDEHEALAHACNVVVADPEPEEDQE